jgi:hypothetical protein
MSSYQAKNPLFTFTIIKIAVAPYSRTRIWTKISKTSMPTEPNVSEKSKEARQSVPERSFLGFQKQLTSIPACLAIDIMIKQNEYRMRIVNTALAAMGMGTLKQHVRISKKMLAKAWLWLNCLFKGYEGHCHWFFSRAQLNIRRPNSLFL